MTLPDWNFSYLEELIQERGDNVIVETAVACPCRNGDTFASMITRDGKPASQRLLSCPNCKGDGFRYRNARVVKGLLTAIKSERKLLEMGYAIPGDCIFSTSLNEQPLSDFDKVTFMVPDTLNEGQVILRGAATLEDNVIYQTDLSENEDRLWYLPTQSIWCEDINGTVYEQNTDFVFDNKKVVWVGSAPDVGSLYTIKYIGYPEWVSYSSPFDRFDRGRDLGQKVLLRRKHVAHLTDSSSDSPSTRESEQAEFVTRTKI